MGWNFIVYALIDINYLIFPVAWFYFFGHMMIKDTKEFLERELRFKELRKIREEKNGH